MFKIIELQKQKGVTRYEVSKRSGVAYRTLLLIERGGDVKLSTLVKIANALNVEVKELFV